MAKAYKTVIFVWGWLWVGLLAAAALPPMPVAQRIQLPPQFVLQAYGQFTAGGLIALRLADKTSLQVDDMPIPIAKGWAVFGYDRDAPKTTQLTFRSATGQQVQRSLALAERQYDIQRIEGVPPNYVIPPAHALPRIAQEARQKRQARNASHTTWLGTKFQWPMRGKITGIYGSQRFYNGVARRPHYGIDIAAPHGSPVRASAAGLVRLAAPDMYFEGGLIFIDHGHNVLSAYLHLGKLLVKANDWVQAGQVIGEVGSGGRSTGAHLDWRIFWRDAHIDPALLTDP